MNSAWRNHGLSIFFGTIFLLALAGQSVAGLLVFNEEQESHGAAPATWGEFVTSSAFVVDVAENWQSEYLQFFLFILATIWLVQKGQELVLESDTLVGEIVAVIQRARDAGCAWKEIAAAFGMSPDALAQRFRPLIRLPGEAEEDRAQRESAAREAARLRSAKARSAAAAAGLPGRSASEYALAVGVTRATVSAAAGRPGGTVKKLPLVVEVFDVKQGRKRRKVTRIMNEPAPLS